MILSSDLNVFLKSTIPKVYNKYYHGFWSMTFFKKSISWDKNLLVLYFVYLAHQPFLLLKIIQLLQLRYNLRNSYIFSFLSGFHYRIMLF